MSPTPLTVALLAAAAFGALWLPTVVAVAAMVAVGVAALSDAWQVRGVPGLERHAPPLLSRGVPSLLVVEPSRPSPRLRIRQPVADPDLRLDPADSVGSLSATITALRRGRHTLPPAATRAVGPLGLGAWHHRAGGSTDIVVYPDLPAARRLALEVRVGRFREEGRRSRGPLGLGTDLESIREYRPDDDVRQVNWIATARTGTPMSNTYRVEQDRDVVCLLDCGRLMSAPVRTAGGDPGTRLDVAVDVVAAMAAVVAEIGDRIGVVAFGDRVIRMVAPRRDNADMVLHAIHDVEPSAVDADYEAAFRTIAGMKRAFVLVLTDLLDERAGEPLARAMAVVARRHAIAVAGVRDEDVHRAIVTPAPDEAGAMETAVAVEILSSRDRLAARLRHVGADVIEAPPPSLAAHCVGAYLRAKRRARA